MEGRVTASKRRFGRVRQLPSGRWQARYRGPDGVDRPAPRTFETKVHAESWLTLIEAEIIRNEWIDPDAGQVLFEEYATDWVSDHPDLRPRTRDLYSRLLRLHLRPALGGLTLA